jgi:signal transduction histidine kinase
MGRSEEAVKREVLAKTLGGLEGPSVLAVLDRTDNQVYPSRPIEGAQRVLTVAFGEALPTWRVALYQPDGVAAQGGVRRQAMLFTAAFALLLVVIALGLGATYRVVRRESEMARLKSDFVANVSHDLKTPLSLIRMFGETLELGRAPDEATRREYYAVITRESERLTRLIDNVLDFSRIEGGRQRYDIAPHPVEPLVHDVLEAFRYPLAQRGFKVDVVVAPDLPDVLMDPAAVKQALGNLVDNAIKYSGERRRLAVAARAEGDRVAIEVADEGIGIPAAEVKRIFEKFYRIGRSETQVSRGSGVGLALVKHIAEAHGGRVTVESRPGEGSRFTLHLPVAGEH